MAPVGRIDFSLFFSVLTEESDDFVTLINKYRLDPAIDLMGLDLSDVTFGSLSADVLNLTNANLSGADLTHVRCKRLILDSADATGAKLPEAMAGTSVPPKDYVERREIEGILQKAVLSIRSYEADTLGFNGAIQRIFSSGAPEYLEYFGDINRAAIEAGLSDKADLFLKADGGRNYRVRTKAKRRDGPVRGRKRTILFRSSSAIEKPLRSSRSDDSLDKGFLERFYKGTFEEISSRGATYKAKRRKHSGGQFGHQSSLTSDRAAFKSFINRLCLDVDRIVLIFIDFLPFSNSLYHELNRDITAHLKFIFVGPHQPMYSLPKTSMVTADHRLSIHERFFSERDLTNVLWRIRAATSKKLIISDELIVSLRRLVGQEINRATQGAARTILSSAKRARSNGTLKPDRQGHILL